jgi:hypothetical protein
VADFGQLFVQDAQGGPRRPSPSLGRNAEDDIVKVGDQELLIHGWFGCCSAPRQRER